jgi:hypothetical protein
MTLITARTGKPVGEICENLVESTGDPRCSIRHAPLHQQQVRILPPLVLPAFEYGREQVEFGEDVAEARGDRFLALQSAAKCQQGDIRRQGKARRIPCELFVVSAYRTRIRRRRELAARPTPAPGAEERLRRMTDMTPERLVEGFERFLFVAFLQRLHLLEEIRMAAD